MPENTALFYTLAGAALLVFVLLSAFFSSAEIAFAKCNKLRFERAAETGDKTAKLVLFINERYTDSLSTILMGNNLVNIAASSLATVVAVSLLGQARGESVAAAVTTVVILLFGETVPKIIAAAVPDASARLFALPIRISMALFSPFVWVVNRLVGLISPLWTPKEDAPNVTGEELCEILEDIEEEGVFSEDESELIKSAIEFTDTAAVDILVPRVDVYALDIDEPFVLDEEMIKYSRIPVYEDSIDNIIGVLPVKKLLKTVAAGKTPDIRSMLLPAVYVHMTRPVSSILEEFRKTHLQLAVVVDEYGGTMGILTLEDITEELVGEIFDERDAMEEEIVKTGENVYEADGGTNIYDLFDEIDFDEPADFESEYTTVGGFLTERLDKFPEEGDEYTYENLHFTVLEAEALRVLKVRVEVLPDEEAADDD
ncbi:MAG: HlyC/CorC family transporter [Clostridia bacterium]|nr:HlyC/CorC family transporter [Clostridia bacterium]